MDAQSPLEEIGGQVQGKKRVNEDGVASGSKRSRQTVLQEHGAKRKGIAESGNECKRLRQESGGNEEQTAAEEEQMPRVEVKKEQESDEEGRPQPKKRVKSAQEIEVQHFMRRASKEEVAQYKQAKKDGKLAQRAILDAWKQMVIKTETAVATALKRTDLEQGEWEVGTLHYQLLN